MNQSEPLLWGYRRLSKHPQKCTEKSFDEALRILETFLASTNVYPQVLSMLSAQAGHVYDAVHIQHESKMWPIVSEGTRNYLVGITHYTSSEINSCSSPRKLQSPASSHFWHREFVLLCKTQKAASSGLTNRALKQQQPLGLRLPPGSTSSKGGAVWKHSIQRERKHNGVCACQIAVR